MAVYKIFPTADATLYSASPTQNTGLDEILEVSVKNSALSVTTTDDIRRAVVKFSSNDLATIKNFTTGSWNANLRLYLANAENLTTTYNLYIYQMSQSWDMGTGKYGDNPVTTNGACWYTNTAYVSGSSNWTNSQYYITPGGGSLSSLFCSQSFDYKANKDINANVTTIVDSWFSGSAQNYGFLLKHSSSIENSSGSYIGLSFFSLDTHTIYPPSLDMKWDDSSYNTGSLSVINNTNYVVTIANNPGTFKADTNKYNFRVNVRDKYPTRVFTTSSLYTTNKALPQTSYWSLQDLKTEEVIFDFDTNYTKISCDSNGSYFSMYMNGLEPERYYRILIRTDLPTGESVDVDNNIIFKVIR
jgi:hypothetical protein